MNKTRYTGKAAVQNSVHMGMRDHHKLVCLEIRHRSMWEGTGTNSAHATAENAGLLQCHHKSNVFSPTHFIQIFSLGTHLY